VELDVSGFITVDDVDGIENTHRFGHNAGFLVQLAYRCIARRLTGLDVAARQAPHAEAGLLGALDQQHLLIAHDKGTGTGLRFHNGASHGCSIPRWAVAQWLALCAVCTAFASLRKR
jgi:hypothetical protein